MNGAPAALCTGHISPGCQVPPPLQPPPFGSRSPAPTPVSPTGFTSPAPPSLVRERLASPSSCPALSCAERRTSGRPPAPVHGVTEASSTHGTRCESDPHTGGTSCPSLCGTIADQMQKASLPIPAAGTVTGQTTEADTLTSIAPKAASVTRACSERAVCHGSEASARPEPTSLASAPRPAERHTPLSPRAPPLPFNPPPPPTEQVWQEASRELGVTLEVLTSSPPSRITSLTQRCPLSRFDSTMINSIRRDRRKPLEVVTMPGSNAGHLELDKSPMGAPKVVGLPGKLGETGGGVKRKQPDVEQDDSQTLYHIPLPARKRKLPPVMAKLIAETGFVIRPALHPPVIHPALQARAPSDKSCGAPGDFREGSTAGYCAVVSESSSSPIPAGVQRCPGPGTSYLPAETLTGYTPDQPASLRPMLKSQLEERDIRPSSAYLPGAMELPSPRTGCKLSLDDSATSVSSVGTGAGPASRESSVSSLSTAETSCFTPHFDLGGMKVAGDLRTGLPTRSRYNGVATAKDQNQRTPASGASPSSAPQRSRSTSAASGDRRHKCRSCPAAFARGHDLRRHENTHTNIRDHGCDVCGRKFSRRDALQRHIGVCGGHSKAAGAGAVGPATKRTGFAARNDVSSAGAKRTKIVK